MNGLPTNGNGRIDTVEHPRLRVIDIRPHAHNGHMYYMLRDPMQLTENTLLVPNLLAAVLPFCDGTRTSESIASAFLREYGVPIAQESVDELIQAMDEAYLLDNERSAAALHAAAMAFRSEPCRPPQHTGPGYPAEPDALRRYLDGFLDAARDSRGHTGHEPRAISAVTGLLSPHIDYPRGGHVYAQVWDQAAEAAADADLVILFGTDHYGSDPFTLTRQSYATPYGTLPTPQHIVDHLVDVLGEQNAFAGELRHRNEHSLELVAVWLHHMRGGQPVELVPILCGSLGRGHNGPVPQQAEALIGALRQEIAGRKALVLASGDLTHVGTAFGGGPLDRNLRAEIRRADDELIDHMRAGDADAFLRSIRRVQNRYNVCGVAPIYLTMRLLGDTPLAGHAAGYASCPADATDTSAVTIGGMLFGPKA